MTVVIKILDHECNCNSKSTYEMYRPYLNAMQLYSLVVPYRKMLITFLSGHENKYINGGFPDSATAKTWSLGCT